MEWYGLIQYKKVGTTLNIISVLMCYKEVLGRITDRNTVDSLYHKLTRDL